MSKQKIQVKVRTNYVTADKIAFLQHISDAPCSAGDVVVAAISNLYAEVYKDPDYFTLTADTVNYVDTYYSQIETSFSKHKRPYAVLKMEIPIKTYRTMQEISDFTLDSLSETLTRAIHFYFSNLNLKGFDFLCFCNEQCDIRFFRNNIKSLIKNKHLLVRIQEETGVDLRVGIERMEHEINVSKADLSQFCGEIAKRRGQERSFVYEKEEQ